MPGIDELVTPRAARRTVPAIPSLSAGGRRAKVTTGPDAEGLITVTLEATDTRLETPCRFSPETVGGDEPQPDDIALVVYDEHGQHYVTAWWPA